MNPHVKQLLLPPRDPWIDSKGPILKAMAHVIPLGRQALGKAEEGPSDLVLTKR